MILNSILPYRNTDIYLIDQVFKERIRTGMSVLDAGCGTGRNLKILFDLGCPITGIDSSPSAITSCRQQFPTSQFFQQDLRTFNPAERFDVVIVNALFHFCDNLADFTLMANNTWNALAKGGLFFARLSTTIALPVGVHPPRFTFLAGEEDLVTLEKHWQARRIDPLKTTLVEKDRTMTTWVLRKPL